MPKSSVILFKYTLFTFPFIFQFAQNFVEMAYLKPEDGGSRLF